MEQNDRQQFESTLAVSRETVEKLDAYACLLREWNEKFNLIAPSTVEHIWTRHFMDSAQLYNLIDNKDAVLADMGSGAGFPGMVLAIMGCPNVHLIESIGKKAQFLNEVVRQIAPHVVVHHDRVENIKDFKADIVTARAMSSLNDLFGLAHRILKPQGKCVFLKGRNAELELTESKKYWTFSLDKKPSVSDPSGVILTIGNLKNAGNRRPSRNRKR
ncbi:MAG: 16S rRNA (guanine(527)-N(7))-methyltransferase RsmG [Alphaproteobacteria bacterium]|nr:16S rRNA (guanine(527)-N(7))-methyltransferase RsmG [Alphaproteobacteria bacterium]